MFVLGRYLNIYTYMYIYIHICILHIDTYTIHVYIIHISGMNPWKSKWIFRSAAVQLSVGANFRHRHWRLWVTPTPFAVFAFDKDEQRRQANKACSATGLERENTFRYSKNPFMNWAMFETDVGWWLFVRGYTTLLHDTTQYIPI
jgi:hypothetical protein